MNRRPASADFSPYRWHNLATVTNAQAPNNARTNFTVDGLGNVTTEASADRGGLTATYDAAGNLLTLSDARGITESHTYDALNRPLTVSYPTTGENLAYTWDSAPGCANGIGRLCRITDNGGADLP
jgi:YD repeat-containing protein